MRLIDADALEARILMDAPGFMDGGSEITKAFILAMIKTRSVTPTVDAITVPEKLKQKMWNALYAEEDKFEEKYAGTKEHDNWFLIYRPWLQEGFNLAIKAIADWEGR